jgi:hypothetical protein
VSLAAGHADNVLVGTIACLRHVNLGTTRSTHQLRMSAGWKRSTGDNGVGWQCRVGRVESVDQLGDASRFAVRRRHDVDSRAVQLRVSRH